MNAGFDFISIEEGKDPHSLYRNMYYYFAPVFPSIPKDVIAQLSSTSYDYFRCLLEYDHVIDDPSDKSLTQHVINGFVLHEKSIKELAYLFESESGFWKEFEVIKQEYFSTIHAEKNLSGNEYEFTDELFTRLAKGKSIFCLAAIVALCYLSDDFRYRQQLDESIINLHIGFQLLDDIDDFKRDIESGQKNYCTFLVDRFIDSNSLKIGPGDLLLKHKLLFVSGIGDQQLQKAIFHFERSRAIVNNLPLIEYKNIIRQHIERAERLRWEIKQSLEKTHNKLRLSSVKAKSDARFPIENAINNSIKRGIDFLRLQLNLQKKWKDFLTSAGESTTWVTSYVGFMLYDAGLAQPWIDEVVEKLSCEVKSSGNFNEGMIGDADSTTFTIGFLKLAGRELSHGVVQRWISYQSKDGGWRTYVDKGALHSKLELPSDFSVKGWMQRHLCVSAAAALILTLCKEISIESLNKSLKFLVRHQSTNGDWKSYWWTSGVYATSFALQALYKNGSCNYVDQIEKGCAWLVNQRVHDGSWQDSAVAKSSPFYTALAVKALAVVDSSRYHNTITEGIRWLLQNQMEDGSWESGRILRIPSPDVIDPENVKKWRKSSFGVNVLVDDHRRNFTTATVINCLKSFMNGKEGKN